MLINRKKPWASLCRYLFTQCNIATTSRSGKWLKYFIEHLYIQTISFKMRRRSSHLIWNSNLRWMLNRYWMCQCSKKNPFCGWHNTAKSNNCNKHLVRQWQLWGTFVPTICQHGFIHTSYVCVHEDCRRQYALSWIIVDVFTVYIHSPGGSR